ncbi:hypothetical protein NEPAR06_1145 [Nematocida parisii]|uniref:Uncharacterized protein n=1 Tax=Nematocida parisii (strain ERTm3) TaxID=935791 RepID=I3EKM0_NEMP3|nr:uncharacterized protein NEPG_00695 [Nematocida parisii ERTm1]EIJ89767.1 hypothetical protein NEQG_00537 [Nematocida parisii ERTm3]KAI5128510.1 hypothetical protein NEPAR08_1268 [Nematocida parisii]EIJ94030.1 hypothetical protein NEPG_00695 [Nematocida parisii ERTm1]KAI5128558.1 hypothetical protein NEPAR03_1365 [Nematocida parisii]KAI5141856.1 hypothetical protein NEPAR04_1239 [Nematocida parisii]|eukprot:XP_013058526.1 hypothetical protein NEPG_00695 [Nematocida parisii ERTm1]
MKSGAGDEKTKEIFAGPSFNDTPDLDALPTPTIPEGFTVKIDKQDKSKKKTKNKKNPQKNK